MILAYFPPNIISIDHKKEPTAPFGAVGSRSTEISDPDSVDA